MFTPHSLAAAARDAEQTFFADPALDRAVGMILALAAEVFVLNDRLRSLEVLLEQANVVKPGALDGYCPSPEETARLRDSRDAFIQSLLEVVKGEEASLGAPPELLASSGN